MWPMVASRYTPWAASATRSEGSCGKRLGEDGKAPAQRAVGDGNHDQCRDGEHQQCPTDEEVSADTAYHLLADRDGNHRGAGKDSKDRRPSGHRGPDLDESVEHRGVEVQGEADEEALKDVDGGIVDGRLLRIVVLLRHPPL